MCSERMEVAGSVDIVLVSAAKSLRVRKVLTLSLFLA